MTITARWLCASALFLMLGLTAFVSAQETTPLPERPKQTEDQIIRGWYEPDNSAWLDTLDLAPVEQEWGQANACSTVDNNPLMLGGKKCFHGIGTHAAGKWEIDLKGDALEFVSLVGVDDETNGLGSVEFEVWVDGKKAASSGIMKGKDEPKVLKADLKDAKKLTLVVTNGGDDIEYDHADWGGAHVRLKQGGQRPVTVGTVAVPPPVISMEVSPKPAINGPRIVGSTPGRPFIFLIPVSGQRPIEYAAENLPAGLVLDSKTGIITGSLKTDGETVVTLKAKNSLGEATRKLKIVGGKDKLALTPPMGWNSWNCWADAVSDEKVRASADAFVKSGLADYGYSYINVDDCWQGKHDPKKKDVVFRNEKGEILPNEKFPNMKALTDYIHAKGLKAGIYSSPGPLTCGGYEGSYKHEAIDAATYAKWGFDYLKYDWCSLDRIFLRPTPEQLKAPYISIHGELEKLDRDVILSVCQYGWGDVWKWGESVGGNLWRTTSDIDDSWSSLKIIGFEYQYRAPNEGFAKYAGPGHWNDPDMLIVGKVGWGPSLHPTRLNKHEQLTHISLWCLQAAPLLIGCDMTDMDAFTLAILTNPELIDVDQDPLGKAAERVAKEDRTQVWARPLYDGTYAVGLFNLGNTAAPVSIDWETLDLSGKQPIRDLWQRKNLPESEEGFETEVQPHGCVVIKVGKPKAE